MTSAIHAQVSNVKAIPSRQVCRIEVEIPIEYFGAAAQYINKDVLVTLSSLKAPYGVLTEGSEKSLEAPTASSKESVGPLCQLAHVLCRKKDFQEWIGLPKSDASDDVMALKALNHIRTRCGVESSKELDTNEQAGAYFHKTFRIPFSKKESYK